jgi:hypothetical protein
MGCLLAAMLMVAGCSMRAKPKAQSEPAAHPTVATADAKTDAAASDDLNAKIQAHADQLLAALERQQAQAKQQKQTTTVHAPRPQVDDPQVDRLAMALDQHARASAANQTSANRDQLPEVQWLDLNPAPPPAPKPVTRTVKATPIKPKTTVTQNPTVPVMTVANTQQPSTTDNSALSTQMAANIRSSDQSALQKALALSSLSLSCNQNLLTSDDLRDLNPTELAQLRKMHTMVLQTLTHQIQGHEPNSDHQAGMNDQITKLFGPASARIGKIEFCRSVSGYGVYDPFESTTFMAGVEQPLILYVELENFNSIYDGNQYRVQLTQEIELYTDADGVRVWFLPREDIVDTSRNKRRDFFTVQLLHLPARLGVGKYRLKVRIHDINGGSYDETTVPITLVASQSTTARSQDTKPAAATATRNN